MNLLDCKMAQGKRASSILARRYATCFFIVLALLISGCSNFQKTKQAIKSRNIHKFELAFSEVVNNGNSNDIEQLIRATFESEFAEGAQAVGTHINELGYANRELIYTLHNKHDIPYRHYSISIDHDGNLNDKALGNKIGTKNLVRLYFSLFDYYMHQDGVRHRIETLDDSSSYSDYAVVLNSACNVFKSNGIDNRPILNMLHIMKSSVLPAVKYFELEEELMRKIRILNTELNKLQEGFSDKKLFDISGYILSKLNDFGENTYEARAGNELLILHTTETRFDSTGRFYMVVYLSGNQHVKLKNGFDDNLRVFTEIPHSVVQNISTCKRKIGQLESNLMSSRPKMLIGLTDDDIRNALYSGYQQMKFSYASELNI